MREFNVLIVTYNGGQSITNLINHLLEAGKNFSLDVLVVDNASTDNTIAQLENQLIERLTIIKNSENYGIAKAFNQGINYFNKKAAKWVLILDQDSALAEDFFNSYAQLLPRIDSDCTSIAAVCSNAINDNAFAFKHKPCLWTGSSFIVVPDIIDEKICGLPVVASSISSGTFYRTAVVKQLGGFKEDYFIDFVDHEYHLKLAKHGSKMVWNQQAKFYHNLGIKLQNTDNAAWLEHPPFRYYYMARNMAHGFYSYGGIRGLSAFLQTLPGHVRMTFKYSDAPWNISWNIAKGLMHAGLGKMGKKPD